MKSEKAKIDISSPEYREMVQKLLGKKIQFEPISVKLPQLPIKNNVPGKIQETVSHTIDNKIQPNIAGFTGNKDVDIMILLSLSDHDLVNACKVNSSIQGLCSSDNFWMNRTINRFGRFSNNITEDKKKHATWKEFYITLVDMLEYIYKNGSLLGSKYQPSIVSKSSPLMANLEIFVERQTTNLDNAIISKDFKKAEDLVQQDFVNPNVLHGRIRYEAMRQGRLSKKEYQYGRSYDVKDMVQIF